MASSKPRLQRKKVRVSDREVRQIGSLQIEEDMPYQKGEWRAQRVGWIFMALLLIAAALGVLGGRGVLNETMARSDDGKLVVTYDRFDRYKAGGTIVINLEASAADTAVRIAVDRKLVAHMQLDHVTPDPVITTADAERVIYTFDKTLGSTNMTIALDTKFATTGRVEGRLGVVEGPSVMIKRFIYP